MPPKVKDSDEVAAIRKNILSAALDILTKEGYASMSMRKVATKVGMSATNIYNYYKNKDEVYIYILTEGFQLLYNDVLTASKLANNSKDKLNQVVQAIYTFGLTKPYYYDLMLSSNGPKCSDYVDTPIEQIVHEEKVIAFLFYDLFTACVAEYLADSGKKVNYEDARLITMKLFCQIHGCINFYNNTIMHQLFENPLTAANYIIESVKKNIESCLV